MDTRVTHFWTDPVSFPALVSLAQAWEITAFPITDAQGAPLSALLDGDTIPSVIRFYVRDNTRMGFEYILLTFVYEIETSNEDDLDQMRRLLRDSQFGGSEIGVGEWELGVGAWELIIENVDRLREMLAAERIVNIDADDIYWLAINFTIIHLGLLYFPVGTDEEIDAYQRFWVSRGHRRSILAPEPAAEALAAAEAEPLAAEAAAAEAEPRAAEATLELSALREAVMEVAAAAPPENSATRTEPAVAPETPGATEAAPPRLPSRSDSAPRRRAGGLRGRMGRASSRGDSGQAGYSALLDEVFRSNA